MSEHLQSGLHPDADQLNAFVEQAMPPHEREQTLAHLAGCSACRAVVSLSLPPAAEVAHPQAEPARRPWFLGWNLAWPVGVAFAALVPLVLYIHKTETARNRAAAPAEIAESRPASPLAPPAFAPMPPASAPASRAAKAPSPPAVAEKPAGPPTAPKSASAGRIPAGISQPRPRIDTADATLGGTIENELYSQLPLSMNGGPREPKASQYHGNAGVYGGTGQTNLNENYVAGVPAASPPPPAAAAAGAASVVDQTAAVTGSAMQTASGASFMAGALALRTAASPAPLPSGLPALSTATRGRLALALDTANTLFVSDDGGRSWQPVPAQWKGRAVSVKLAAAPAATARGAVPTAGAGFGGFAAGALTATPRQNSGVNSGVAGIVTDPTGAVIPNAAIAVTDAAGQAIRDTQAGPDGRYRIEGLAPGSYHLQARAPGFQRLDVPIALAASQQNLANLTLQVGAATESVTVTDAPALATDDSARAESQKKATLASPLRPTPLFEITTESGERWISPDGQTWTRRP